MTATGSDSDHQLIEFIACGDVSPEMASGNLHANNNQIRQQVTDTRDEKSKEKKQVFNQTITKTKT